MNEFDRMRFENECYLCEQDSVWSPALEDILTENGIVFRAQKVLGAGLAAYVGPILERTEFYVSQEDYEAARAIVQSFFSAQEVGVQCEVNVVNEHVRPADAVDLERIAEIEVFNYRLNFYPIFKNDEFYFDEFRVSTRAEEHEMQLEKLWIYDDGVIKGFIHVDGHEIKKLFVEPALQGKGIGAALIEFAVAQLNADFLWALEKNTRAIAFYNRHGFSLTGERKPEDDTDEYLVRLERSVP